jgi:hypothetical protein
MIVSHCVLCHVVPPTLSGCMNVMRIKSILSQLLQNLIFKTNVYNCDASACTTTANVLSAHLTIFVTIRR